MKEVTIKDQVKELLNRYSDFQNELTRYNSSIFVRMFNEKPIFSRYWFSTLYRSDDVIIELRISFSNDSKRVSISVNEKMNGYNYNVVTGVKTPLINAKGMNISKETEEKVLMYAKEYNF